MRSKLTKINVLDDATYFSAAAARLRTAKKDEPVSLISMTFDPDEPRVQHIINGVLTACSRGARVTFVVDAYSFINDERADLPIGPLMFGRDAFTAKSTYFAHKAAVLKRIELAGGHVAIINKPVTWPSNPTSGRSHIKAIVVGPDLFLGGCNLSSTQRADLAIQTNNETAADYMHELISGVAKKGSTKAYLSTRDRELSLDPKTSLLVDCGVRGQSLIFERGLEMIDNAQQWLVMACQYFPNSITARHLNAAINRGVRVTLYYNNPWHHPPLKAAAHQLVAWHERTRVNRQLFVHGKKSQRKIHAKLIATDKGAILGSHNFVNAGVRLGTAESAIIRYDPDFARQAVKIFEKALATKKE